MEKVDFAAVKETVLEMLDGDKGHDERFAELRIGSDELHAYITAEGAGCSRLVILGNMSPDKVGVMMSSLFLDTFRRFGKEGIDVQMLRYNTELIQNGSPEEVVACSLIPGFVAAQMEGRNDDALKKENEALKKRCESLEFALAKLQPCKEEK